MAITIKRSTDAGVPTLSNTAGSLIALLDYLLVTTLGWTKPYTGTNLAAYKQPAGSNGFYLQVTDTATGSARIVGYETMTDASTGTGPFPTAAQLSGGGYVDKVASMPWKFFSNGKIFYLFCKGSTYWWGTAFGDISSYKSADAFHTLLLAQIAAANATVRFSELSASAASLSGHFMARPYTQLGSSKNVGKFTDAARTGGAVAMGSGGASYPNPINGALQLAPVWVSEGSAADGARGLLPGIWCPLHSHPLTDGDTFTGTGVLAGRTFEAVDLRTVGEFQCFVETSDTWGGF